MTDLMRILVTRGIELCAEWDKNSTLLAKAADQRELEYHYDCQLEASTRLDEVCRMADLLNLASYDGFRVHIQEIYKPVNQYYLSAKARP